MTGAEDRITEDFETSTIIRTVGSVVCKFYDDINTYSIYICFCWRLCLVFIFNWTNVIDYMRDWMFVTWGCGGLIVTGTTPTYKQP